MDGGSWGTQSGGFCGAQYGPDVTFLYTVMTDPATGIKFPYPERVMHTRMRTQHTPLRTQEDFIQAMLQTQHMIDELQHLLPQVMRPSRSDRLVDFPDTQMSCVG